MNWDHLNRNQKSLQIIRTLRALSVSDGKLSHSELAFIREIGVSHGLSVEEVDHELIGTEQVEAIPDTEQDRMTIMYYMVFLIKADRDIDEEEEKLIYHYGFKLGFREELIRDYIKLAKKYINSGIPVKEMLDRIKKYLN